MEDNEVPDDGQEQSSAKVVTGVRMSPGLKDELIEEASYAGLSVSEYSEVILLNRHKESPEVERLAKKVSEQQQEIERLKAEGSGQAELKTENEQLKKQIEGLNNQLSIYSDQRLLYLFEHLKGKTDTVENAYGKDFKITYESAREVLTAIIYNTKLNQ
jgi:DNA-binding transcriptional MerR regulator